jgi:hypothetical protein
MHMNAGDRDTEFFSFGMRRSRTDEDLGLWLRGMWENNVRNDIQTSIQASVR